MKHVNEETILKKEKLHGSDIPLLDGGYLYLYRGDELIGIVAIPSPNLMAENHRDSLVSNSETLCDNDGNEYTVDVHSSMHGIEWEIVEYPEDENILKDLRVEVKPNVY